MPRVMPETWGRGVEGTPSPIYRLYRRVHRAKKMGRWLGDPSNRREILGTTGHLSEGGKNPKPTEEEFSNLPEIWNVS